MVYGKSKNVKDNFPVAYSLNKVYNKRSSIAMNEDRRMFCTIIFPIHMEYDKIVSRYCIKMQIDWGAGKWGKKDWFAGYPLLCL